MAGEKIRCEKVETTFYSEFSICANSRLVKNILIKIIR